MSLRETDPRHVKPSQAPGEYKRERSAAQLFVSQTGEPFFSRQRKFFAGAEPLPVTDAIAAAVASLPRDKQLLAVATLNKKVFVFRRTYSEQWQLWNSHDLPKRITAICLDDTFTHVVISDAIGDVYRLPSNKSINARQEHTQHQYRILGHFSTITDISLTNGLIATADRDNKIRISRYPCSHVIESFCLSHTSFITCVEWTRIPHLLLSASGDDTLRLWSCIDGQQVDCINLLQVEVIRKHLRNVTEALVVCIIVHPMNKDVAFFALYDCSSVFVVSGMKERKLKDIGVICTLGLTSFVSGLSTCEKGRIYVSVREESGIWSGCIQSYEKRGQIELSQMNLEGNEEESMREAGEVDMEGEVLRFEWLAKQRKKEMVSNWKGKKRRHIEI